MKKLLFVLSALMMSTVAANAAIVACDTSNPISFATWTGWTGSSNGCQLGDKIFSNFVNSGAGTDTTVTFGAIGNSYTINYTNTGGGGFASSFSISYDISICYAPCATGTAAPNANWKIVKVAAGLQDSNANGNAQISKTVSGGASGVATAKDVNGTITPTVITGIQASSLHVVDAFSYTSGIITNISNTFTQADTGIPEPTTVALVGFALVGLGVLRRRA